MWICPIADRYETEDKNDSDVSRNELKILGKMGKMEILQAPQICA